VNCALQRVAKKLWAATADERWTALSKIQAMAGFAAFHARIALLVSGRVSSHMLSPPPNPRV